MRTSKVPNTVRTTHRSDFKKRHCQPCSNGNKKEELHKRPRSLTEIINGHKVLLHGGIGKVHGGGPLISMKVTMEMNQVLTERGDLLYSIWNNSSGQDFQTNLVPRKSSSIMRKSFKHTETDPTCKNHKSRCTSR